MDRAVKKWRGKILVHFSAFQCLSGHDSTAWHQEHNFKFEVWRKCRGLSGSDDRPDRDQRLHHCLDAFAPCRTWQCKHLVCLIPSCRQAGQGVLEAVLSFSAHWGSHIPHVEIKWSIDVSLSQDVSRRALWFSSHALTKIWLHRQDGQIVHVTTCMIKYKLKSFEIASLPSWSVCWDV